MLLEMTGQKSVPNVFINKTHVGGCDKTLQVPTISTVYSDEALAFGGWEEKKKKEAPNVGDVTLTTQSMYAIDNLQLFYL